MLKWGCCVLILVLVELGTQRIEVVWYDSVMDKRSCHIKVCSGASEVWLTLLADWQLKLDVVLDVIRFIWQRMTPIFRLLRVLLRYLGNSRSKSSTLLPSIPCEEMI